MIKVIGAGPTGAMTAIELAKKGLNATVYEEHSKIGSPVQCTGIVTRDIENIVKIKNNVVENRIKKATVICGGTSADLPVNDIVIDRKRFDQQLADAAENEGVKFELGKRINKLPGGTVIGADGPGSIVAGMLNPNRTTRYLTGKQAVVEGIFDKNAFTVYLGSIAPGFFGWVVPLNKDMARIGLAASRHTHVYFDKLLAKLEYSRIHSYQAGLIPVYNNKLITQRKRFTIVGDAATQVKATTGGGLVPGLQCAKILADCIHKHNNYAIAWKKTVGKELNTHLRIRNILDKFSDKDYVRLIGYLDNCSDEFQRYSRDESMKLMLSLFKKEPRLARFATKLF